MIKNFLWAFLEKGGFFFLQFVSVFFLGRLLNPSDYGIYGTMIIFISIAEMLIDSGFGGALVQKQKITQVDIDTLFWTNVGIGISMCIVLFFISPIIQNVYNIPLLSVYLRAICLTIIFYSFTIVQITILQRNLQFKKSAIIMVCSSGISILSAIAAAYCGLGIWALIIQKIFQSFFLALLLWIFVRTKVGFNFSKSSFHSLWTFGSKLLGANILQSIYNNICTSIIPKIASLNQAGNYAQASKLNSIPINIMMATVDKVAFPVLSKECNSVNLVLKARNINKTLIFLLIPLFPVLSLFSKEIIHIVLGNKWDDASIFLSIIAWGGWGLLFQTLYRNIYKSLGDATTIFKVDSYKTLIGLLILITSSFTGVYGLLCGLTISMYIGTFFYMFYLNKDGLIYFKTQVLDSFYPVIISLCLFLPFKLLCDIIDFHWYNIFLSLVYLLLYVFINWIMRNPLINNIIKMLKK